jgi:hypothetical protein
MSKRITHLAINIQTFEDNGEEYSLTIEAGELEKLTPTEIQTITAKMIDNLLMNEGMIEVTREELTRHAE